MVLMAGLQVQAWSDGYFHLDRLQAMDHAVEKAIQNSKLPGGVLWLEKEGRLYTKAYGDRALAPSVETMTLDTVFDAASLTKVVATTPSIMLLIEEGKIGLDSSLSEYMETFRGEGRENITVRHCLTHTSGLRAGLSLREKWVGYHEGIKRALAEIPTDIPGTVYRYSDVNFILLGELVRRVTGTGLDVFAFDRIFEPLGMTDTCFLPNQGQWERIAPTTKENGEWLRGVVHDPTSRRMGGVAGHAGLFTRARDLALFARMILNHGEWDGVWIFHPDTVRLMTSVQAPTESPVIRGLGWDIASPYSSPRGDLFPGGSFGHTGWTGTSIWIDPFSRTFILFLSNRNHPTESGSVVALRRELASLAARAVPDFNFAHVPGSLNIEPLGSSIRRAGDQVVLNGVDRLEESGIKGRVGLITNHTGIDRNRQSTIDLLHQMEGVTLAALFSPEHGIRGEKDEKVGDSMDAKTGLPVYSLYGETRKPLPDQLNGLDVLVFDIQDIGCRYYTYVSTMGLAMEAAAEAGIPFIVLDRVNPIQGAVIDGPVLQGEPDFVGYHALPIRHGMTTGELASMFKTEKKLDTNLQIVSVKGWARDMYFDECRLPWVNTSPNIRRLDQAILYPGVAMIEFAEVSVGRGTDTPFELVGAPYLDEMAFVSALRQFNIPGVSFVPVRFTPSSSRFAGEICQGVRITLTDRDHCPVIRVGLALAQTLHEMYPDNFSLDRCSRLLRHPPTLAAIREGQSFEKIESLWTKELEAFRKRRALYLLY